MMEKRIKINGDDCASLFTRFGYSVSYKKVHGNAGGTMLDGRTTEDVIAIKAIIKLQFMPFREQDLHNFFKSIYGVDYDIVEFYDPRFGGYRTIEAIVGELTAEHKFININDDDIWIAGSITLTER